MNGIQQQRVFIWTRPHNSSLLPVWIFIRQRKANYLQQAGPAVTSGDRAGSVNNYPTSKIRFWSIYSEVFVSRHVHGVFRERPLKSLSSFFKTEYHSSCWTVVGRDVNHGAATDELKVYDKDAWMTSLTLGTPCSFTLVTALVGVKRRPAILSAGVWMTR